MGQPGPLTTELARKLPLGIPLGRIATPDDIAEAVAYLVSPAARQITMHTLTVDGGASLGA
jgi:2,3-dihydro-2,3-dihydroxybenzoate dehydrogenase